MDCSSHVEFVWSDGNPHILCRQCDSEDFMRLYDDDPEPDTSGTIRFQAHCCSPPGCGFNHYISAKEWKDFKAAGPRDDPHL